MGKSKKKLGSSRSPMEERDEHLSIFSQTEWFERVVETLGRKGKGINIPMSPAVT